MSNKGECTLHDPKPWYEADSLILRAIEVTGASFAELDAGVRLHVDSWDSNYADTFLISCKVGWGKYLRIDWFCPRSPFMDSPWSRRLF